MLLIIHAGYSQQLQEEGGDNAGDGCGTQDGVPGRVDALEGHG